MIDDHVRKISCLKSFYFRIFIQSPHTCTSCGNNLVLVIAPYFFFSLKVVVHTCMCNSQFAFKLTENAAIVHSQPDFSLSDCHFSLILLEVEVTLEGEFTSPFCQCLA